MSFQEFMTRLDAGSDTAPFRLFDLYGQRLIALARTRLDRQIRSKADPEDVVQSVFKSFFVREAAGEYNLRDWDRLWALLVKITINKCINRNLHFRTGGRDVAAESANAGWDFIDRAPGPQEAAELTETMQEAIRGLDETDRKIIEMWLQEYTHREIASKLKRPQATVQRVIARVRDRLKRILSADASQ